MGLQVVEVSTPNSPVQIDSFNTPGFSTNVTLANGYIYVADTSGGLFILRDSNSVPVTPTATATASPTATMEPSPTAMPTFTSEWNGRVSSDWHTASNWTPSGVPTLDDDVLIPNTTNPPVISNDDVALNSLILNPGAVLDLTSRTLTVEETLTNNGTLKQTQEVAAGSTTNFLRITNQASSQTTYYGVAITPSDISTGTLSSSGPVIRSPAKNPPKIIEAPAPHPQPLSPRRGLSENDYRGSLTTEWTLHKSTDNLHPDDNEQQVIWLMNRARANPTGEGRESVLLDHLVGTEEPNEAPTDIALSKSSVAEGQPIGTTVGTFTTTDPNASDTHTYSLVVGTGDDDNSSFTIEGATLKTAAVFDVDSQNSYDIRVETDDGRGETYSKPFTISVSEAVPISVTVSISGNQFCANRTTGVKRCFDIDDPTDTLNATVRFYFSEAERNGHNLNDLEAWHYSSDSWQKEAGPYSRGGTGDAQYVEVQNVDDFSPFALDSASSDPDDSSIYLPLLLRNYPPTYTISGNVTDNNSNPLTSVTISTGAGYTTTTDASGHYTLSGLPAGTYTLTPAKDGYTFTPFLRSVTVPPDATEQNFVEMALDQRLVLFEAFIRDT